MANGKEINIAEEMSRNMFQVTKSLNVLIGRGEKVCAEEKWKVLLDGGSHVYGGMRFQKEVMK